MASQKELLWLKRRRKKSGGEGDSTNPKRHLYLAVGRWAPCPAPTTGKPPKAPMTNHPKTCNSSPTADNTNCQNNLSLAQTTRGSHRRSPIAPPRTANQAAVALTHPRGTSAGSPPSSGRSCRESTPTPTARPASASHAAHPTRCRRRS
jgi:hypothetical protein